MSRLGRVSALVLASLLFALAVTAAATTKVTLTLKDGALLRTIDASNHVYSVAFSPDGQWLASGGRECGALGTCGN
ncbi:MAG: WD40 domain-containing protein [Acidobacteriota bacterium]|nr:WD40 domain-containing protein [Acidobacteriota bacterium]